MNIKIKTIPHNWQRYDTVGDWEMREDDTLIIKVSRMDNWKYELLVGFHELVETVLCKDRVILQADVDEFDMLYEKNRKEGDVSEPGNSPNAPYYKEHKFATKLEKMLAKELNVDWKKYDDTVINL
jgi:hypothetical protein